MSDKTTLPTADAFCGHPARGVPEDGDDVDGGQPRDGDDGYSFIKL